MAEQKACAVFHAREAKSFHLRVNHSITKDLPDEQCIEIDVPVLATAGFRCTTKYWPRWEHRQDYDKAGWIKISVVITRTQQQFRHKVVAAHIDLPARNGLPAPRMAVTLEPVPAAGDCEGGVSLAARRGDVEANCVTDDHFTAVCTVAVSRGWPPLPLPTPSRLDYDISVAATDLADVSFQVEGETFAAHRLVLAARSPVFKAELFGQMRESQQATTSIAIQDMRASTFKSMLDYMYHGLLPVAAPEMDSAARVVEFQDLYVSADRYGLDTLKEMCEEVLCAGVSVSTVLSSLVFADERGCPKLKSRCLGFLAVLQNFKEVAVTNEYVELMKDDPALLAEVQNWFKRPRLL